MPMIRTPPASTLSLHSDTEINDDNNNNKNMPAPRALYLIVATALKPSMGIGLKGDLPWQALKKDMSFFRRITSNVSTSESGRERLARRNAVLMGRKTWESIPPKFRPLKGRINVVVTRDVAAFAESDGKEVLAVRGLQEGLEVLEELGEDVGRTFVIGGSQIYGEALRLRMERWDPLRVLQTQVRMHSGEEIECDAFFPVQLDAAATGDGWRQASGEEVQEWVESKTVPGGDGKWEADGDGRLEIRVVGWEKMAE